MAEFTHTGAQKLTIAGVTFIPGDTKEIPDKHLERVRKAPCVTSGTLKEGKAAMPAAAPDPAQITASLSNLDVPKAKALIRMATDLAVLEKWSHGETRPEILTAIKDRAEALAAPK